MMIAIDNYTSGANLVDKTIDIDSLCEEDCQFLLKTLEKQAFEQVVFALRAQGPLTKYKEAILDHLKSSLFIDDDEFFLRIKMAVNNPYLSRIAQELNPLYDNFTRWTELSAKSKSKPVSCVGPQVTLSNRLVRTANKITTKMKNHNNRLPNKSMTLRSILLLPKEPYVPERLRSFLRESEINMDRSVRMDTATRSNSNVKTGVSTTASLFSLQNEPVKKRIGRPPKNKETQSFIITNSTPHNSGTFNNERTIEPDYDKLNDLAIVSEKYGPILSPAIKDQDTVDNKTPQKIKVLRESASHMEDGSKPLFFSKNSVLLESTASTCARVRAYDVCARSHFNRTIKSGTGIGNSIAKNNHIGSRSSYMTRRSASNYTTLSTRPDSPYTKRVRTTSDSECSTSCLHFNKRVKQSFQKDKFDNEASSSYSSNDIHLFPSSINDSRLPINSSNSLISLCNSPFTSRLLLNKNDVKESCMDNVVFVKCDSEVDEQDAIITDFSNEVTLVSSPKIFYDEDIQNQIVAEETFLTAEENDEARVGELSALDFLATTASLFRPLETRSKADSEPKFSPKCDSGNLFNESSVRRYSSNSSDGLLNGCHEYVKERINYSDGSQVNHRSSILVYSDAALNSNSPSKIIHSSDTQTVLNKPRRGRPPKNKNYVSNKI